MNTEKELEDILLEILAHGGDDPDSCRVNFRFGIACFAAAILTTAMAVFFKSMNQLFAVGLVGVALCQALAGAWFVDLSTKMTRRLLQNRKKDRAALSAL